jgi:hypothetical protein
MDSSYHSVSHIYEALNVGMILARLGNGKFTRQCVTGMSIANASPVPSE